MKKEELSKSLQFIGQMQDFLKTANQVSKVFYPRHFYVLECAEYLEGFRQWYGVRDIKNQLLTFGVDLGYETVQKAVRDLRKEGYLQRLNSKDERFKPYKYNITYRA